MRPRISSLPWVGWAALALIAAQLVVRAVLAFGGYFYWDDLILIGRAGTHPLLSPAYLFDDHDGHVMPGAYLVSGALTKLWPLQWAAPAVSLLVPGSLLAVLIGAAASARGVRSAARAWRGTRRSPRDARRAASC